MRLAPSAAEIDARLGDAWPVSGAIDCHAHVFEEGFPTAAGVAEPRPYPVDYYLGWLEALRIKRCVHVTASCYGFDNSITRFAVDECQAGGIVARGIAIVHPEIEEAELASLARAGFVGARLMASRVASLGMEAFDALARRCAPLGWHIELNADTSAAWSELEPRLAASPVALVFEHLGVCSGDADPGIRALLRLLERRKDFAVKLRLPDLLPVLGILLREFPDRLMWGSSLPQRVNGRVHDDLELLDSALKAIPDRATRARVFAANAERFYGF
jgi:D-galactarolactone isomerase